MQKKKGISLIVLVITIIVMIILAASVVITLSNTGIIDRADYAVDVTDLKQVQQLASIAWGEAYIDKVNGNTIDLEARVLAALEAYDVDTSQYTIIVTETGVNVAKGWVLNKVVENGKVTSAFVKKGNKTVEVGTMVNYMPDDSTTSWVVLGADEDGRLLIVSVNSVLEESFNVGYVNLKNTLDAVCLPYADGKNGILARCLTVEDMNKITGFEPVQSDSTEIGAYGTTVTYYWNGDTRVRCETSNGQTGISTDQLSYGDGFVYFNEEKNEFETIPYATSGKIISATSEYYEYPFTEYLDENSLAYIWLISRAASSCLASTAVYPTQDTLFYVMRQFVYGGISYYPVTYATYAGGEANVSEIRAVVTLADDVEFSEREINNGDEKIKILDIVE